MLSHRTRFPDIEIATSIRTIYTRMFMFALIGFVVFFSGAYLTMKYLGDNRLSGNPYAGAPPFMTCLFIGAFGLVGGALVGLIRKNK